MIVIYDFDGTLTPYALPKYEVLRRCGYDGDSIMPLVLKNIGENGLGLYEAYFSVVREIIKTNGFPFNKETMCIGVKETKFNKGILEYFEEMSYKSKGIRHYVVTSGFKDYVEETIIARYLDGVLGTTFDNDKLEYGNLKYLMDNSKKIEAIKQIINNTGQELGEVIYICDGLTDMDAFKYVHENGGKSILVCEKGMKSDVFKKLSKLGIIDFCTETDYSLGGLLYNYINNLWMKEKKNG